MQEYKNKKQFLQFQLWTECHRGCKFCCNRGQPLVDKLEGLNYTIEHLYDEDNKNYEEIGIIGGEFFNEELKDEAVKQKFYELFNRISKLSYEKIYITTSLIFDMKLYLLPFLDYLRELNLLNKTLLCTSYDFAFRFHKDTDRELWKSNMKFLYENYPELKLHTEIIVMQYFIDAVLNDTFSITKFKEEYHTSIDYIEPASGLYFKNKKECSKELPGFFPTKSSFMKFVVKTGLVNKEINLDTFLSMELRSSKLYYLCDGVRCIKTERRITDGRPIGSNPEAGHAYDMGLIDEDDNLAMIKIARRIRDMKR